MDDDQHRAADACRILYVQLTNPERICPGLAASSRRHRQSGRNALEATPFLPLMLAVALGAGRFRASAVSGGGPSVIHATIPGARLQQGTRKHLGRGFKKA